MPGKHRKRDVTTVFAYSHLSTPIDQWECPYCLKYFINYIALHCITLHRIALHCITFHYIVLHCITFHCLALICIALHCITWHYIALHYIALRCIALHYITLHYITLHYIILHYLLVRDWVRLLTNNSRPCVNAHRVFVENRWGEVLKKPQTCLFHQTSPNVKKR